MTDADCLLLDADAERELRSFVGATLDQRGREAGDTIGQLGAALAEDSIEPADLIAAHDAPVGFLEEHHVVIEAFCDDLDEDAAELLRHAASIHSWCVATARRLQRGEDPQHYADGARSAIEWADESLEELAE